MSTEFIRARKELNKFMKKERKSRELTFYKEIVKKNMPQTRIEALMTSYQSSSSSSWIYQAFISSSIHRLKPLIEQAKNNQDRSRPSLSNPSSSHKRPVPKDYSGSTELSEPVTSKNPYINDKLRWLPRNGPLCVKCGKLRHDAKTCKEDDLVS